MLAAIHLVHTRTSLFGARFANLGCSDPFVEMAKANKTYGFTIAVKELRETVPNIFRYASAYKRKNNIKSQGLWEMFLENPHKEDEEKKATEEKKAQEVPEDVLISENGDAGLPEIDPEAMEGESYNMCHFWSNFEIARLDFFRSQEYEDFFEMMDRSGGFWMERVRSAFSLTKFTIRLRCSPLIFYHSGAMHLFILWPLEPSLAPVIFTTSAILAIDILPFSIVLLMPRLVNYLTFLIWKKQPKMRKSELRRMNTGRIGTL